MGGADLSTYIEGFLMIVVPITLVTVFSRIAGFVVALCISTVASCGAAMVSNEHDRIIGYLATFFCVVFALALGSWLNKKAKEQSK